MLPSMLLLAEAVQALPEVLGLCLAGTAGIAGCPFPPLLHEGV
jgi:hypothetical protein